MESNPEKTEKSFSPEDVRASYSAAIALWAHEGSQVWAKFTGMVYAHTIMLLTIVALFSVKIQHLSLVLLVFCGLGLLMCIAWWFLNRRGFAYEETYIAAAREIEDQLQTPVRVATRGRDIKNPPFPFNFFNVKKTIYCVIISFAVVYCALLLFGAWHGL